MAPSPQPKPDSEPTRFAVFNIEVRDGLLRYTDRVLKQEHRVEQLQVGVPFVSNLPSDIAVEVQPRLQARIDGSPLKIEGKTLPFQEGHRSEVQLAWQSVDVAHWLTAAQPFLPPSVKIAPQQGQLDTNLTVHFEQRPEHAVPMLRIAGGLQLSKLGLSLPQAPGLGQVDTGWQLLKVEGLDALPLEKQVRVASVSLDGLHLKARPLAVGAAASAGGAATPVAPAASRVAVTPESSTASDRIDRLWRLRRRARGPCVGHPVAVVRGHRAPRRPGHRRADHVCRRLAPSGPGGARRQGSGRRRESPCRHLAAGRGRPARHDPAGQRASPGRTPTG